jgi:hypothetical protein
MNTKTLLIAAAALAAGVMTSQAQVYSQNIVGYINVPLNPGYNLVANQLDLDGTGTNNSVNITVGTNTVPNLTQILAWNGAGYSTITYSASAQKWSSNTQVITNAMNPGSGFFIKLPATSPATNITFVGNVITGTNSYPVAAGYSILAPSGPVAGTLDGTNGMKPTKLDQILVWTGSGYTTHTFSGTAWNGGGDPQLTVGQSVFYKSTVNTNWTQILNVQ